MLHPWLQSASRPRPRPRPEPGTAAAHVGPSAHQPSSQKPVALLSPVVAWLAGALALPPTLRGQCHLPPSRRSATLLRPSVPTPCPPPRRRCTASYWPWSSSRMGHGWRWRPTRLCHCPLGPQLNHARPLAPASSALASCWGTCLAPALAPAPAPVRSPYLTRARPPVPALPRQHPLTPRRMGRPLPPAPPFCGSPPPKKSHYHGVWGW